MRREGAHLTDGGTEPVAPSLHPEQAGAVDVGENCQKRTAADHFLRRTVTDARADLFELDGVGQHIVEVGQMLSQSVRPVLATFADEVQEPFELARFQRRDGAVQWSGEPIIFRGNVIALTDDLGRRPAVPSGNPLVLLCLRLAQLPDLAKDLLPLGPRLIPFGPHVLDLARGDPGLETAFAVRDRFHAVDERLRTVFGHVGDRYREFLQFGGQFVPQDVQRLSLL